MAFGTPPFAAHSGGQGEMSGMGVVGTLGTSDVNGTAQILPISVDAATGAQWQREIGTPSFILQGGTLNVGTMVNTGTNVNIITGTVNSIGSVLGLGGTVVGNMTQWGGATLQPAGTLSEGGTVGVAPIVGAVMMGYNGGGSTAYDRAFIYSPGDNDNNDRGLLVQTENKLWNGLKWARWQGTAGTAFVAVAAGTVQESYPSFNYISAAGTTTIKSGAGILQRIIIGSLTGAGTLYNSVGTSATVIWATSNPPVNSYEFNLAFGSLTWAGTGAQNVTIVFQ